ncbi:MAG: S8 family peptidase [Pseudomonadota bacterium]
MKHLPLGIFASMCVVSSAIANDKPINSYAISYPAKTLSQSLSLSSQNTLEERQYAIASMQNYTESLAQNVGIKISSRLKTLAPISFADLTAEQAQVMRNQGMLVEKLSYKYLIQPENILPGLEIKAEDPIVIAAETRPWGIRRVQAPGSWGRSQGNGIKVCIIDTGIDRDHPDLDNNFVRGVNTYFGGSPEDGNGHGTHVAGTIAAEKNTFGVVGVAPKAKLHIAAAFSPFGFSSDQAILSALDWCVSQNTRVINMSYGGGSSTQAEANAYRSAYNAGVVMVAATGNSGAGVPISYPARYPWTIAVGATNQGNGVASFSQRGPQIDVVAPGVNVLSTAIGGGTTTLSGTSMATPHVTGAVANLLKFRPNLGVEAVRRALRNNALNLGSPGFDNASGSGLIRINRTLNNL